MLHLNDCSVITNPDFGSHDPSMMYDPVSGNYYSYSTDVYMPRRGLTSRIGIPVRVSKDLVHFRYLGTVLSPKAIGEGADNGPYPPTREFWAPFAEYVNGEYRLYYSATKAFGSWESRIWLAVSDSPEGPFENRGVVMDTWFTKRTSPNAIDPHIIRGDGRVFLVYGSFFGGIYLKELDETTGLSLGAASERGVCISRKPKGQKLDGPEGASMIFHPGTGFYYLFQSYGWLGDTYDIRVGRSRCVEGPYVDFHGRSLVGESHGLKLAGSYCFASEHPEVMTRGEAKAQGKDMSRGEGVAQSKDITRSEGVAQSKDITRGEGVAQSKDVTRNEAEAQSKEVTPGQEETQDWQWEGFRGPGHGVPFYDPRTGQYYFVHHIRDGAKIYRRYDQAEDRFTYGMHYLMVRRMYFTEDGWPVFSPEPFAGEEHRIALQKKKCALLEGNLVALQKKNCSPPLEEKLIALQKQDSLASGEEISAASEMQDCLLRPHTWELLIFDENENKQKKANLQQLSSESSLLQRGIVVSGWDFERGKQTYLLTGIDEFGLAYWGKCR